MIKYNNKSRLWNIIRPEILLSGVMLLSVFLWVITPERITMALTPQGKYISFRSFSYLFLCILSFWIGAKKYKKSKKDNFKKRLLFELFEDPVKSKKITKTIIKITCLLVGLGLLGNFILLYKGFSVYGSILEYIKEVYGGSSLGVLKRTYFGSTNRIPGLTTMIFLMPNAAVLSYFLVQTGIKWRRQKTYIIGLILLVTSLLPGFISLTITQGSRGPILNVLLPLMFTHIIFSLATKKRVLTKTFKNLIIVSFLIILTFAVGDYTRNYLPGVHGKYSVSSKFFNAVNFPDALVCNLLSYFYRTINNCFVVVDHISTHTIFYRLLNFIYTGFNINQIDPGGLIATVKGDMYRLDSSGVSFFAVSNCTIFGYYFIDIGWWAILIFFLFGMISSISFYGLTHWSLLSWLTYPILITSILDAWRTDMISRTPGIFPLFVSIIIYFYLRRKFHGYR